jgi:hypothetical protein
MKQVRRIIITAALAIAPATACSDGGGDGSSNGPPMDSGPNNTTPTFTDLFSTLLLPTCAGPFCHGTAVGGMLVMANADIAYQGLVNQPAQGMVPGASGVTCASTGLMRVVPGEPEMSLLYLKLFDPPPCGDRMPVAQLLTTEQIEQIRLWIEAGALNN